MAQHCIKGKRIRRVCIPKEYDIDKIQIGIPVICDEAKKVGLIKNGDVVLPSGIFGAQCRRNASVMFWSLPNTCSPSSSMSLSFMCGITCLICPIISILSCVSNTHMKLISSTVNLLIFLHLP